MIPARLSAIFIAIWCLVSLSGPFARAEEHALASYRSKGIESSLAYPQFGHTRIDSSLAHFAAQELRRRTQDMEREFGRTTSGQGRLASLEGGYTLFYPSRMAVSILFELRAASPLWEIPRRYFSTRSYLLSTGEELTLADLFPNLPNALEVLAKKCSPKVLAKILEQHTQERLEMVWFLRTRLITPGYPLPDGTDIAKFSKHDATAPVMSLLEGVVYGTRAVLENYKHFALVPDGLHIHFESFPFGGPETGALHVILSLKELQEAKPHLKLWGK